MNLLGTLEMFERATFFSALIVLVSFGILGYQYCQSIETKNSPSIVQK